MECFKPLSAYRLSSGEVVFVERGDVVASLFLPCGQCIGCRLERSRQWAVRIMHEASLYEENCWITLTYDDDHLPRLGGLEYADFQRFMRRLRKKWRVRFFVCGEYGDKELRPHFHAVVFGYAFRSDRKRWKKTEAGFLIDRSAELEALWPFGHSSVGDLAFESACYVARYVTKKVTKSDKSSPEALEAYDKRYMNVNVETGELEWREPEFCHMSLKPGIGADWFKKFGREVYPSDRVIARGVPCKPPRYYDKLIAGTSPELFEDVKVERVKRAVARGDNTDARLRVKEEVAYARLRLSKRSL